MTSAGDAETGSLTIIAKTSRALMGRWRRLIIGGQDGRLAMYPGLLSKARQAANSGTLETLAWAALDAIAPEWRHRPPEALDAERRELVAAAVLGEVRRIALADSDLSSPASQSKCSGGPIDAPGIPIRAEADSQGASRTRPDAAIATLVRAAGQGALRHSPVARAQLRAVRDAGHGIDPRTAAVLDMAAPGWQTLTPWRIDEGWHIRRGRSSPAWRSDWLAAARDRRLGERYSSSYAWLRALRSDADSGSFAPGVEEALDRIIPGWRTLGPRAIDLQPRSEAPAHLPRPPRQGLMGSVAPPQPPQRRTLPMISRLDERDQEMLQLAREGRLRDESIKANNWLARQRQRLRSSRLSPEVIEAMDTAAPSWRVRGAVGLDAEWERRRA